MSSPSLTSPTPISYNNQKSAQNTGLSFIPPQHLYIQQQQYGSAFFKDNNEQQYYIQRAFKANNFTSLRDLPDSFSRNCVLDQRKDRVREQVQQQATKRMRTPKEIEQQNKNRVQKVKKMKIGNLGYFQMFPYEESQYDLQKRFKAMQRVEAQEKRKKIDEKDFRPAGFDRKLKHQDPFRYVDRLDSTTDYCGKSQYIFPFHLPEDVYDSFRENQKRLRIVQNQLKLAGQFVPSQTEKSLSNVSKGKMPQILNEIQFYFKKFLKEKYGYLIGVNKRDIIQILFEPQHVNDMILHIAMNGMLQNQILSRFALRKNYSKWGNLNNSTGYLQFVILPAWVKDVQILTKCPPSTADSKSNTNRFSQL